MGYVFTLQEFSEGRVPDAMRQCRAVTMVREGVERLFERDMIYGAVIHGSTMHTDGGVGSDIDVLVVANRLDAEDEIRAVAQEILAGTFVPVDFVTAQRDLAEQGHHTFDSHYVRYISDFCREGIIGRNPLDVIAAKKSWQDPEAEARERFVSQLSKLSKSNSAALALYEREHCDLLEKMLRWPLYSAIDMLRLRYASYPSKDGVPLSKKRCCEEYAKAFPEMQTGNLFAVLGVRERYKQFVKERGGAEDYRKMLDEMGSLYPSARAFIRQNMDALPVQRT